MDMSGTNFHAIALRASIAQCDFCSDFSGDFRWPASTHGQVLQKSVWIRTTQWVTATQQARCRQCFMPAAVRDCHQPLTRDQRVSRQHNKVTTISHAHTHGRDAYLGEIDWLDLIEHFRIPGRNVQIRHPESERANPSHAAAVCCCALFTHCMSRLWDPDIYDLSIMMSTMHEVPQAVECIYRDVHACMHMAGLTMAHGVWGAAGTEGAGASDCSPDGHGAPPHGQCTSAGRGACPCACCAIAELGLAARYAAVRHPALNIVGSVIVQITPKI